jgi:hypothetical protein
MLVDLVKYETPEIVLHLAIVSYLQSYKIYNQVRSFSFILVLGEAFL